jgi:hypothetical protein
MNVATSERTVAPALPATTETAPISNLAAVFEEQHFRARIFSKVKANRPVTPLMVLEDTATRTPAMDLVDARMTTCIEFAPRFDEDGAPNFLHQQLFQRDAFVFDKCHNTF